MAILNIKNLPDALYDKLKARAERERRSITQEVTHILSAALEEPDALAITDLRGLGRDLWADVDAAEHVARERRAWE